MKKPEEIKKGLACCEKMDKDDAISREYCLDTIAKLPLNWEYGLGVEDCYKIVENAPSVDGQVRKWISVEDRLPTESDGTVLVCFPDVFPYNSKEHFVNAKHDQRVKTATYSEHSRKWYVGDMASVGSIDPTHWMPLPKIPKEE